MSVFRVGVERRVSLVEETKELADRKKKDINS
jgi:hypothetical protein